MGVRRADARAPFAAAAVKGLRFAPKNALERRVLDCRPARGDPFLTPDSSGAPIRALIRVG